MQRKWYHTPFKDSVIVPKLFPDTLSIPPNKLPPISISGNRQKTYHLEEIFLLLNEEEFCFICIFLVG